MKNVFLIGDSIRRGAPDSPGYGCFVEKYLGEGYAVYAPEENCRFAQYTQRYLFEWADKLPFSGEEINIVHWNNGLWDVLELPGEDGPFTDLPFYISSLRKVYHQIKRVFPNAKVIFATSTPVDENAIPAWASRRNAVIREYNEAAKRLMEELGVEVNDLYRTAQDFDLFMRADWVHYNEEGSRALAKEIADFILRGE